MEGGDAVTAAEASGALRMLAHPRPRVSRPVGGGPEG